LAHGDVGQCIGDVIGSHALGQCRG
jgi:hypothetical protein